nr:YaaC family protein [Mycobacterium sp. UM_NZ2]
MLEPPFLPGDQPVGWPEQPHPSLLMEALTRHSELKAVGTARMRGTQKQKNDLWVNYRNFVRQAMSNFQAAMGVPNRSSSLLYYYAMLNFAKAELLSQHHALIIDKKIGHGLSFSPIKAKTVAGDFLTVNTGVFPLLYAERTGRQLRHGTRLPLKKLLAAIPEIGAQLDDSGVARSSLTGFDVLFATDSTEWWLLLRLDDGNLLEESSATRTQLLKFFTEVKAPGADWRDKFAISRRFPRGSRFLQSKKSVPSGASGDDLRILLSDISDIYAMESFGDSDALITPYLYKTKTLVMPPSLARYAVTYYASSLVRYRPSAFDADRSPVQAYLFDAVARECAVPMLIDTLSRLEGRPQLFRHQGSFRL